MEEVALYLGYSVMFAGGLLVSAAVLTMSANFINRGVHQLLDAYGGWKVFLEYKKWYHSNRKNQC